jgi:hypothetical protein
VQHAFIRTAPEQFKRKTPPNREAGTGFRFKCAERTYAKQSRSMQVHSSPPLNKYGVSNDRAFALIEPPCSVDCRRSDEMVLGGPATIIVPVDRREE